MAASMEDKELPLLDLGEIYKTHARDLKRFALYLSGDSMLADDLVADAFARAWTVRDRIESVTVRGYLFAIVRNLFLKHRRARSRQAPLDSQMIDDRPGPEDRAQGQSELGIVLAALDRLPETDRTAVLMRTDEGMPYEDIALALGISTVAAKVKVHRARLRLAETLDSKTPAFARGKEQKP